MKKLTAILISMTLAITLLAACGAGGDATPGSSANSMYEYDISNDIINGSDRQRNDSMTVTAQMPAEPPVPMPSYPTYDSAEFKTEVYSGDTGSGEAITNTVAVRSFAEKIIYSYHAGIETVAFEETLAKIQEMIDAHGAFVENSSIQGSNYETSQRGWPRYRTAYYIIRVPVEQLGAVTGKLDTLGNVISQSSNAENITSQFLDNESRLNSLRIQEERLLDMLAKAEDVPDLLTIETTLADVRYQIERITTTLNHWQQQVDYSTLTLNISEVEEYQEPPPPVNRTYWERMGDDFLSTLRGVGRFFTDLFMWLVVSAPVLVILAVIAVAATLIIKRKVRKSRAKQAEKVKAYTQAYAQQYGAGYPQQQPQPQPLDVQPPLQQENEKE